MAEEVYISPEGHAYCPFCSTALPMQQGLNFDPMAQRALDHLRSHGPLHRFAVWLTLWNLKRKEKRVERKSS